MHEARKPHQEAWRHCGVLCTQGQSNAKNVTGGSIGGHIALFVYGKIDGFAKSPRIVMPDLIRHPEHIELTGFRLSPE